MRITDKNTRLVMEVTSNVDGKIISVTFFGAPKIIDSVTRQLGFFEHLSYEEGVVLSVELKNGQDGSITITDNCKGALLFIAQHKFMDLSPETRTALKQVCLEIPQKTTGLFDTLGSLFHRKSNPNPEQTPLKQPSPQMPVERQL